MVSAGTPRRVRRSFVMTKLTTFNFQYNEIRVGEINGEPWFPARDVLNALDSKQ